MNNTLTLNKVTGKLFLYIILSLFTVKAQAQITYSSVATPIEFASSSGAALAQTGDFDNDGDIDVIMQPATSGAIIFQQNNGSGTFSTPGSGNPFANFTSSTPTGFTTAASATSVADYDNDGDLDIWCRISGTGNDIYLQNNSGTYVIGTTPVEFTPGSGAALAQVADFDGDGDVDIIYQPASAGAISYYQNNSGVYTIPSSNNPFTNFTSSTPAGFSLAFSSTCVGDFDNDGDIDIWCRINGTGNDLFLRNISGVYTSVTTPIEFTPATSSALCQIGDFDGDGDMDAIFQPGIAGAITYHQNDGSGTFSTPGSENPFSSFTSSTPAGFSLASSASATADFDGDGDFDIWCRLNNAANDIYIRGSGVAPNLISSNPAHEATGINISANIVLTFSESITAGTGNIYIRRLSDNFILHTLAANGSAVGISGNTVTIDPPINLPPGSSHYITFDETALRDVDGIIFGRLDENQKTRTALTGSGLLRFTTAGGTLPLTLLSFTGKPVNEGVALEWKTTDEVNTEAFDIERADDGGHFRIIATVYAQPGGGNYSHTDKNVLEGNKYLYRLKMRDLDGKFTYSNTIAITAENKIVAEVYSVFPNPVAASHLYISPVNGNQKNILVRVIDMSGKLWWNHELSLVNSRFEIPVQQLPAGIYMVQIQDDTKVMQVKKFTKL